jgi:hypothetical protein
MLPGGIMIKHDLSRPGELRISRFQPGKEDQRATVPNTIPAVLAGIVAVGGGYGDAIAMLRTAKDEGYLKDQLAIDPLPAAVRTYYRDQSGEEDEDEADGGLETDQPEFDEDE